MDEYNSCGKKISVKDSGGSHTSFCGCTYKGLHLCDDCKSKKGDRKPEEIWMEKEQRKEIINKTRCDLQNKFVSFGIFDKDLIGVWDLVNQLVENEKSQVRMGNK